MKIEPDDQILTAFVLGELDTAEHAEVEALIQKDPVLTQAVADIQEMTMFLKDKLGKEKEPRLDDAHRAAIDQALNKENQGGNVITFPWSRFLAMGGMGAVAATLLVMLAAPRIGMKRDLAMQPTGGRQEVPIEVYSEATTLELGAADLKYRDEYKAVVGDEVDDATGYKMQSGKAGERGQLEESLSLADAEKDLSQDYSRRVKNEQAASASESSEEMLSLAWDPQGTYDRAKAPAEVSKLQSRVDSPALAAPQSAPVPVGKAAVARKLKKGDDRDYYSLEPLKESRVQSVEGMVMEAEEVMPADVLGQGRFNADFNREGYEQIIENAFLSVGQNPLSTFSIDVDTASYANLRRMLNQNTMPPRGAVRIEEMINYFDYQYPNPSQGPFSVTMEMAPCPWETRHQLLQVGLKGREIVKQVRPATNLVFLIDVSGSMSSANKLPWLKQSMKMLINELDHRDRVAIVVYAGSEGLALPSTSCQNKQQIIQALDNLKSGGSTNGGAGIELAYKVANDHFIKGGVNRVVLATDGDFNVGRTSHSSLHDLIAEKAQSKVFLSVLGFGMGNYQDGTLELLADKGNGNYAYIDSLKEARKVLVEEMSGTLITIAKDVKIQIEFNPGRVEAYRLIGYENRVLAAEDFNNDKKDAGEIGAGHTVTAIYEIVPKGEGMILPTIDPLKYQRSVGETKGNGEWLTVKLRYKPPTGDTSSKVEVPFTKNNPSIENASQDWKFAASVAGFGMLLRDSEHKGGATYDMVLNLANQGLENDAHEYRAEFISLVQKAKSLSGQNTGSDIPVYVR